MSNTSSIAYLPNGLPAPQQGDTLDGPFWEGTQRKELRVQVCRACNRPQWPPEEICSNCRSFERVWIPTSGRGEVFSWTRVWHPVHPALEHHGPYLVIVVELSDYPIRIVGNLLGDPMQPVTIGMTVRAEFEDRNGYTLVQWAPFVQ